LQLLPAYLFFIRPSMAEFGHQNMGKSAYFGMFLLS